MYVYESIYLSYKCIKKKTEIILRHGIYYYYNIVDKCIHTLFIILFKKKKLNFLDLHIKLTRSSNLDTIESTFY